MLNQLSFEQDMDKEVRPRALHGSLYEGDDNGLMIQVALTRGAQKANITGSVIAEMTPCDGVMVVQNGGHTANIAYVTIPISAMKSGPLKINLRNVERDGTRTTILALSGFVNIVNGSSYIDPGTVIPALSDYTLLVQRAENATSIITGLALSATEIADNNYKISVTRAVE